MENEKKDASYSLIGFCSESCTSNFWQTVMTYPLSEIGTDIHEFPKNIRQLFYKAILNTLRSNSSLRQQAIDEVMWALRIETGRYRAIAMGMRDNGTFTSEQGLPVRAFVNRGYSALAQNLEKCGRPLDAAEIYEKHLKMYDKARQLRERDKQIIVRRTDVKVNLNDLLKQVKDGGIVAVYRCPHCNGTLRINNKTSIETLRTCEHCGNEIAAVDLADFLRAVLPIDQSTSNENYIIENTSTKTSGQKTAEPINKIASSVAKLPDNKTIDSINKMTHQDARLPDNFKCVCPKCGTNICLDIDHCPICNTRLP